MYAIPLAEDAELRPLEPWQAAEFLAHIDRARPNTDPWIPWASRSTDLESARATLQLFADKQASDTGRIFGIWHAGALVGGVMFVHFDTASGNCEIGVWTEPAGEGRGLVSAAVRHLIDYALIERGMHRVEWFNSTLNARSRAVAERMGMQLDGVLREYFPHNGIRHDKEVWSMLAEEWRKTR
ncbi:GNAT family protein [Kitasatospora atroaurantiaca]|uniref:RimJ/RimL family protein N-acetyltransferase n=1 Tax=Kitasatospora atroaurantiaca TaxID=285545 RepID=A0A561EWH6_9ACTN|nr:GNAT family protein [Kitasatospora atroaurantiaca]TWE19962.1 RimJ/RimL family protein N-acetyltransferase [Kitasatospora atroaurantiaca]